MRSFVSALLGVLALLLLSPSPLRAAPVAAEEGSAPAPETSLGLEGKALRIAIKNLDRTDPAVRYARKLRIEGQLFLLSGAVTVATVVVAGAVASTGGLGASARASSFVSLGVPLGVGVMVAGVPGLLSGYRYLAWYANHEHPPSQISRLKLMNRWRRQVLQVRRDTGLFGSAFVGAATLLAGVGWAVNDDKGYNGTPGEADYNSKDGMTTLGFGAVCSGLAVSALLSGLELKRDPIGGHPVFGPPAVAVSVSPQRLPLGPSGYRIEGSLSLRF